MGLFDWRSGTRLPQRQAQDGMAAEDERAIARYRYMLRTAPPEAIEQAHAEAFAALTPAQRRMLLERLAQEAGPALRPVLARAGDDPQALARAATRAEIREPGALERIFGGAPGGAGGAMPGFGSMMAGSLLGSVAGTVLGSMIARDFFAHPAHQFGGLDALDDQGAPAHDGTLGDESTFQTDGGYADADPGLDTGIDIGGDFDGGTFDV
jgi:hypothetical protein